MCPIFLILSITILLGLGFLLAMQSRRQRKNFESKGILYLGNGSLRLALNAVIGKSQLEDTAIQYGKIKSANHKLGVTTDFGVTTVTVTDIELIKSILVRDFDHFVDRRKFITGKSDHLIRRMLFVITGDRWKQLRPKLSPTFTKGKMKRMYSIFNQSGQKLIKFLNSEIQKSGNDEIELSVGYSKYAMDIVASAACGIDSQAFNQREPSFVEVMGKGLAFQFRGMLLFKIFALMLLPQFLVNFLNISLFPPQYEAFFSTTIKGSIKERTTTGKKRDDFVQLMLEARAGTLKTDESEYEAFEKTAMLKEEAGRKTIATADLLDDDEIVANCVLFILAGFDTSQSLLLFCAYALALHVDIQEKLRSEVDAQWEEGDGKFTFDGLNGINYLEMFINETLRFYPSAPVTDRTCTKDYKFEGTNLSLKKGDYIWIPIYGLHHDPTYFDDPETFDPERFSPENKNKINSYAYLPFGQGPRNCIGMRFAVMQAKVAVAYLVHHFNIEVSPKTSIPMKYSMSISAKPKYGLHLRLKKIREI